MPEAGPTPGRFCPTDYRLGSSAFGARPWIEADVLYVVGGLYGNTVALEALLALFESERAPNRRIVFNGDFHWFDRGPGQFERIERLIAPHLRLRGNVETELAREGDDAGCGCAYPDEVDDATVERSNRILRALKRTARATGYASALGSLAMVARARVGACRVAITHGDDRSLAGWRLASDAVGRAWDDGLASTMGEIGADVIASSHTCVPVASTFVRGASTLAAINNGAAGMANFSGSTDGLFTRIAVPGAPLPRAARALYRARVAGADVAAIALEFEAERWIRLFESQWPPGSDAFVSYHRRIVGGTALAPHEACAGAFSAGDRCVAA